MTIMLAWQIIQLLLLIFGIIYCCLILWEFRRIQLGDVPFVPSTNAIIETVIASGVLPKEGMILDLGCGDGKALRRLWHAGYKGPLIGYERAPFPMFYAIVHGLFERTPVKIHFANYRTAPLEDAKGIYLFLLEHVLQDFGPVLKSRLSPGTVVVSAEFPIKGWEPVQVLMAKGITAEEAKIYVYKI